MPFVKLSVILLLPGWLAGIVKAGDTMVGAVQLPLVSVRHSLSARLPL